MVSSSLERLIRNIPIDTYAGYELLYQCQKTALVAIKNAFSVIENDYSVKIPDSEIAYIYDIVYQNTDNMPIDEDF